MIKLQALYLLISMQIVGCYTILSMDQSINKDALLAVIYNNSTVLQHMMQDCDEQNSQAQLVGQALDMFNQQHQTRLSLQGLLHCAQLCSNQSLFNNSPKENLTVPSYETQVKFILFADYLNLEIKDFLKNLYCYDNSAFDKSEFLKKAACLHFNRSHTFKYNSSQYSTLNPTDYDFNCLDDILADKLLSFFMHEYKNGLKEKLKNYLEEFKKDYKTLINNNIITHLDNLSECCFLNIEEFHTLDTSVKHLIKRWVFLCQTIFNDSDKNMSTICLSGLNLWSVTGLKSFMDTFEIDTTRIKKFNISHNKIVGTLDIDTIMGCFPNLIELRADHNAISNVKTDRSYPFVTVFF